MKTFILVLATTLSLSFASCIQDAGVVPQSNSPISPSSINGSSWVITYFWDSDKEETQHFVGYVFSFNENNSLQASNGASTITGSWSFGTDDSQQKLIISFTSPDDFEELSDDWHILEFSESKIRLEDVSGGNGGIDYLTFEKM